MSSSSTQHSSRVVFSSSSSGGQGQGQTEVTEIRTYTDADGNKRTESRTRTTNKFDSQPGNFGVAENIGDLNLGQGSKMNMHYGLRSTYGGDGEANYRRGAAPSQPETRGGTKSAAGIRLNRAPAVRSGSRYSKGWGSQRQHTRPTAQPMQTAGKTFEQIKAECLRSGQLFEDPDFPAIDASIFYSRKPPRSFVWKRPGEICDAPKLFVGGASRFDVRQGELGDCWLLAAVASLCSHKDLLYNVVPPDQSFGENYAGIFRFRFWQYGKWTDVIVDDRLPTYYDKLVFMHSAQNSEFWTPLLEKAFAKLVGSYEALKGGATCEAMEDFTGGLTEMFDFRTDLPTNMWQILMKANERNSLMGCSIEAMPGQMEAELPNGLIAGHAYSVTAVKLMEIKTSSRAGKMPMVRIRNPWGNDCEWKGAWSDQSREWKFITDEERRRIGLVFSDDGEFWMSFQDFVKNFQKLEICNLGPDSMSSESLTSVSSITNRRKWEATNQEGSWHRRVNAGGCRNFLDTFWTNPQYRVEVVDPDDDDDDEFGTIIIALMQKGRRKLRKDGLSMLTIGYAVYKIPDDSTGPLGVRFFKYNASVAKAPSFINLREVCGRHKLKPGSYCILPSTFEPNQEADFLLRIFSEKQNKSAELDEETGMSIESFQFLSFSGKLYHKPTGSKIAWDSPPTTASPDGAPDKVNDKPAIYVDDMPKDPMEYLSAFMDEPRSDAEVGQDEKLHSAFRIVAGEDMEIDAYELKDILNQAFLKDFKFDGFTPDTCRSMVAMMDTDTSGKLNYEEFRKLWNNIRLWKAVFKKYDKDASGTFNSFELREAFRNIGFTISNSTFQTLVMRYSHKDGQIAFDDYIHCVVRMRTMFDVFNEMKGTGNVAKFTVDQFIQTTMYA